MVNKDIIQAKQLIEQAKNVIEGVNVKGSASVNSKIKAVKSLNEALKAINWMVKMDGSALAGLIDKWHEDDSNL